MQNQKKTFIKLNNKYKKQQIVILALIVLSLLSIVIIFGRYVTNTINNYFVRSREFYFNSDKLSL